MKEEINERQFRRLLFNTFEKVKPWVPTFTQEFTQTLRLRFSDGQEHNQGKIKQLLYFLFRQIDYARVFNKGLAGQLVSNVEAKWYLADYSIKTTKRYHTVGGYAEKRLIWGIWAREPVEYEVVDYFTITYSVTFATEIKEELGV